MTPAPIASDSDPITDRGTGGKQAQSDLLAALSGARTADLAGSRSLPSASSASNEPGTPGAATPRDKARRPFFAMPSQGQVVTLAAAVAAGSFIVVQLVSTRFYGGLGVRLEDLGLGGYPSWPTVAAGALALGIVVSAL